MGGAGSRLKTEDMARFILFVSRHGKWEGKQLLNAEWFDMASANQVSTISPANNADNPDWRCGYGFQFWRCVPEHVASTAWCLRTKTPCSFCRVLPPTSRSS